MPFRFAPLTYQRNRAHGVGGLSRIERQRLAFCCCVAQSPEGQAEAYPFPQTHG